jgi:hypothetical protein
MQRLQTKQLAALVPQLHAGLAQLGGQRTGKVRHRHIGAEVDDDNDLERLEVAARGILKRRYSLKIDELQQRAKTNK